VTTVEDKIRAVIVSLDRVCPACLAAYSKASWIRLHSIALMRRLVADYERRAKMLLGFVP
jgi:hypothetical protein